MPAADGHDVCTEQRVRENLCRTVGTQHQVENFPAFRRDLVNIRVRAVGLFQVCLLKALDRGKRICLPITGKTPGADGAADQVHWPRQLRHDGAQNRAIQLAQDQPLRAARCARQRPDRRYVETLLADGFEGTRARFECQRERFHSLWI